MSKYIIRYYARTNNELKKTEYSDSEPTNSYLRNNIEALNSGGVSYAEHYADVYDQKNKRVVRRYGLVTP